MGGSDDEFEQLEFRRLQIDRPVGTDVGFDTLEHAESSRITSVDAIDLGVLPRRLLHRHAPRDSQAVGVVGDPRARVASRQA